VLQITVKYQLKTVKGLRQGRRRRSASPPWLDVKRDQDTAVAAGAGGEVASVGLASLSRTHGRRNRSSSGGASAPTARSELQQRRWSAGERGGERRGRSAAARPRNGIPPVMQMASAFLHASSPLWRCAAGAQPPPRAHIGSGGARGCGRLAWSPDGEPVAPILTSR
jgi:hypothetical protein